MSTSYKNNETNEWTIVKNNKKSIINNNKKKVLCNNIILKGSCYYGDKCIYAHSIHEQKIEKKREIAYDIIMKNKTYDKKKDPNLFKTLLELTKVCEKCVVGKCPGGLNCKFGVFDRKYQVCENDLRKGVCKYNNCNYIHLSENNSQPNKNLQNVSLFFKRLQHLDKKANDDGSDTESENSNIRTREYLDHNSDSDTSCDRSIFQ